MSNKLVMVAHYTDGCTYNCTETTPIWYESVEKALLDFENLVNETDISEEFVFCGENHFAGDYRQNGSCGELPDFYTVEEWFEKFAK